MGYRNATSTVLNFGEKEGAIGYLVGEPHRGLTYMFQMMNESRIGVGAGAAALGYLGYQASLNYARERPQGRQPSNKDPKTSQVKIIEHADVRRMLLEQKAYAEGALALCLYASSLIEDSQTANTKEERDEALQLLDLITPIVKSWPSRYGLIAHDLAIQVLGGSGYMREYPVEQCYRDNRLNPIHEGTEGIQALDLLGRKILMSDGNALSQLLNKINQTITTVKESEHCSGVATPMNDACELLNKVTEALKPVLKQDIDLALANATIYLDMFGNIFVAWIWLCQAHVAEQALVSNNLTTEDKNFYLGKLQAARYFFHWKLPQINSQADLLINLDKTPLKMQDEWF